MIITLKRFKCYNLKVNIDFFAEYDTMSLAKVL